MVVVVVVVVVVTIGHVSMMMVCIFQVLKIVLTFTVVIIWLVVGRWIYLHVVCFELIKGGYGGSCIVATKEFYKGRNAFLNNVKQFCLGYNLC